MVIDQDVPFGDLFRQRAREAPPVRVASRDLQFKWGFEDGDAVFYWAQEHVLTLPDTARRLDVPERIDDVLYRLDLYPKDATALLVLGLLVPHIEQEIAPEIIASGTHNMVITETVDGQRIEFTSRDHAHPTRPEEVAIDGETVWEVLLLTRSLARIEEREPPPTGKESRAALESLVPDVLELGLRRGHLYKADLVRALHSSGPLMNRAAQRVLARVRFTDGGQMRPVLGDAEQEGVR